MKSSNFVGINKGSEQNVETKRKVRNINDIMSKEILQMMNESSLSKILSKVEKKYAEDSLNDLDQNLEHANLFKDDNV